ncbi:MAG: hypothetical protein Hals2KO_33330 [Halioglobus sp.]
MKGDQMDKVAAVAKMEAQKSALQFSERQKTHGEKLAQLEQLVRFKEDYEQRLSARGGEGMDPRQLQDYRLFLSRLNEAITQQTQELQGSEESLQEVRQEWASKHQRNQALDQLVEDRQRERSKEREKLEQKRVDDNALTRNSQNNEGE